ncbi:MAG: exosortase/archaeosortase family protein [Planctomycetota bacterium]|jgi:exosortase
MLENTVSFFAPNRGTESHLEKEHWRQLPAHVYVKIFIIGVLFVVLFRSEIHDIVRRWVTDSSWSHGFLIPLFSLYFIDQRKQQILNLLARPNYLGLLLLICCIVFYPFNIVHLQYGYLRPMTMIATLGAVVLLLGGWRLVKYTWLPSGYRVFAVPVPHRDDNSLADPMRRWAATIASGLLNLVPDLEASANGKIIDVFYRGQPLEPALDVAEACSGMRLLLAFMALGVAMAYLHERRVWQRLVLVVSTVPIAILCNIVRVTVTGFIYILIHPKYAQGIYHDMLGMAMLPLAFGLYGLLALFMSNLFVDDDSAAGAEDIVVRKRDS